MHGVGAVLAFPACVVMGRTESLSIGCIRQAIEAIQAKATCVSPQGMVERYTRGRASNVEHHDWSPNKMFALDVSLCGHWHHGSLKLFSGRP